MLLLFLVSILTVNAQSIVEQHGQLRVEGNRILDEHGAPVQLKGMSFFWSQWMGQYYNYETVKWLRDDWNCTVVRAAMGVDQGGYASNPEKELTKVVAVVDAAIALGIYVIIDFHIHDGQNYKAEAITFFKEMAQRYGDKPNVLYETWNEPYNTHSWAEVIKPYHEGVIAAIREIDPDNIIICGTRTWSQQVDEAAANPINKPNIAYTLHYYGATHKKGLRDIAKKALDGGVALFVTEYGTTEASGDGYIDEAESRAWWDFLNEHKISHLNWSVTDKRENSAALLPGASATGGWPLTQISRSGKMVREELLKDTKSPLSAETDLDKLGDGAILYPNPAVGTFVLNFKGSFSYSIYDESGRLVEKGSGNDKASIGAGLEAGIYLAKIQSRKKQKCIKLFKQ